MGTHYTLTVRRPYDRKIIAEVRFDVVKVLLYNDEDIVNTRGEEFKLSDVYAIAEKCRRKQEEIAKEIAELKEGRWKCANRALYDDVVQEIGYKEEALDDWKCSETAAYRMAGIIECVCEDMMMPNPEWDDGKDSDGWDERLKDEDGNRREPTEEEIWRHERFSTMAYRYWAAMKKEEEKKDEYDRLEYCWAEDAILSISGDW